MKRSADIVLDANGHEIAPKVLKVMKISQQQPPQRDPSWHRKRHEFITASELASTIKISDHEIMLRDTGIIELETTKKVGQVMPCYTPYHTLLQRKCEPPVSGSREFAIEMEWGVTYEPVATALQEAFTGELIHGFNLIPHPSIKFLAASPDGITSSGSMVEIKCPFSRVPSGKPKLQYWIQMQSQMACCDMESCEFLEVVIREYGNRECYLADRFYGEEDGEFIYSRSASGRPKGIIIERQISGPNDDDETQRKYYYPPVLTFISQEEEDQWLQNWAAEIMQEITKDPARQLNVLTGQHETYALRYWYIEAWHAVTIMRDRVWFEARLPDFQAFWNEVERNRALGVVPIKPKRGTSTINKEPLRSQSKIAVDLNGGCDFVDDGDY